MSVTTAFANITEAVSATVAATLAATVAATIGPTKKPCLNLVTGMLPPFVRVLPPPIGYYGVAIELMKIIAKQLKFCYTIFNPKGNVFGSLLPNGSWTGITGMLVRKEVDFTVGPLAVTADRSLAVAFAEFYKIDDHVIIYKYPTVEPDVAGFVKPFSTTAWAATFTAICAIMIAIWVTTLMQEVIFDVRQKRNLSRDEWEYRVITTARKSIFLGIRTVLGQGIEEQMPYIFTLMGMWMFMSFILGATYKGILMSMLIAPKVNIPFKNYEDLISSGAPYQLPAGSYLADIAQQSEPSSLLYRVYHGANGYESRVKVISKNLYSGAYAYITYRGTMLSSLHRGVTLFGFCTLSMINDSILKVSQAVGFPKGSKWLPKVDRVIKNLNRFGIIQKLLADAVVNATACLNPVKNESSKNNLRVLVMQDFMGVFMLYGLGAGLGITSFVFEMMWRTRCCRSRKTTALLQRMMPESPTSSINSPSTITH